MFNNELRKVVQGDEHSYMTERKMAHPCLLQCLLTLQMFSCKSVDAASFLALTCWLNTPLLLWIAAVICWCLPALQGEGTSWRERDRSVPCESGMLKSLVCIVGSGMQFLNCLHCLTEEFFLPTSVLGYLASCASEEQDKPVWVVNSFA